MPAKRKEEKEKEGEKDENEYGKNVNALKWVSKASPPSTVSMMRMAVHTGANTNLPDAKSMRQTAVLFYGWKHAREKTLNTLASFKS